MKLNYNLDEQDYFNFQLYYLSHNENTIKQRKKSRLSLVVVCVLFCIVSFVSGRIFIGYYFLLSTVICFFFFPKYSAWLYKRTIRKHVAQIYKDHPSVFTTLSIENQEIEYTRRETTAVLPVQRINKIIEIAHFFYIKMSETEYIIIPKEKLSDEDEVRLFLKDMCQENKLDYSEELKWQWK